MLQCHMLAMLLIAATLFADAADTLTLRLLRRYYADAAFRAMFATA